MPGEAGGPPFAALVLAGGQARRLGGVDKPALMVGERSLLDTVLLACAAARQTVVVGPRRPTCRPVLWAREEPMGGGPAAALGAGLQLVSEPVVVLLAADLPFVSPETVGLLLAALAHDGDADGAMLVDDTGRDQVLCSAWRTSAVRTAVLSAAHERALDGASLRSVLGRLSAVRVSAPTLPGRPPPWTDCDTPADLERARSGG